MINPSPSLTVTVDVVRAALDYLGLQNQIPAITLYNALEVQVMEGVGVECEHGCVIDIYSGPLAHRSGHTSAPRRLTAAEHGICAKEHYLRRRLTSLSYLDSPSTDPLTQPSGSSSPQPRRRLTDSERSRLQEYANAHDNADMDENTEQRSED